MLHLIDKKTLIKNLEIWLPKYITDDKLLTSIYIAIDETPEIKVTAKLEYTEEIEEEDYE